MKQQDTWPPPNSFLQASDLSLQDERLKIMSNYLNLLLTENKTHNLTAITDIEEVWNRHILEAIMLERFIKNDSSIIDVGSGGGLPGIPLAIMRPDLTVTLLEATQKKADFLQRTAEQLNLNQLTIVNLRAEDAGQATHLREQFDYATCRALGSLPEILELCLPLIKTKGHFLTIKGQKAEQEIEPSRKALALLHAKLIHCHPLIPSDPNNESVLLDIEKQQATPTKYPRRSGMPKKRPLGE